MTEARASSHGRRFNGTGSRSDSDSTIDEPEHLEGILGDGLVVLVVTDHRPTGVGRKDLRRPEMLTRERALARVAGADEDDEGQFGDRDRHGPYGLRG